MKTIAKILVLSLFTTPLFAQLDLDALRFSQTSLSGNARFVGMGGAFGALGGNLSTLSTNPAGIGIYRNSEFSFTPSLTVSQTKTTPDEGNSTTRRGELWNFNLGNLGWVGVIDLSSSESKDEWKKVQFGIGLNRLNDFWNRSNYSRYATLTYLDALTSECYLTDVETDDYYCGLAMDADLIHFDTADGGIFYNDLNFGDSIGLSQYQSTRTTGAINEWVFSIGGNYGDYLFIGATIGVPSVKFRQTKSLTETDTYNEHQDFHEWRFQENLDISGSGVNLKLGAIFKPADFIRIGLAFHTPTRYKLTEKFSTQITTNGRTTDNLYGGSTYNFTVRTPMRLIGSLGLIIAKKAVIGVEYEHVNYSNIWLDDDDGSSEIYQYNDYIFENYVKSGTLKVGAEYRLNPVSLRVGYNYMQTPFKDNTFTDFSQQTFSCGVGFYLGSMTLDLAYANTLRNYKNEPYPTLNVNKNQASGKQFLVSLGFRF